MKIIAHIYRVLTKGQALSKLYLEFVVQSSRQSYKLDSNCIIVNPITWKRKLMQGEENMSKSQASKWMN